MRTLALLILSCSLAASQTPTAEVDFGRLLQEWDGFGVNYVEAPQTRDYKANPQEYGGLSTLPEADRERLLDLIWGDDGLRPGVLKMFLDPWHQSEPGGAFDHETTTKWMRLFARDGLKRTRAGGGDLQIVTTLYGPPAYMTKQKFIRGRDLDPAHKGDLANYLISWTRFLREKEGLPVKYISLHNEGEDFNRWPVDGKNAGAASHDYNLFWPPLQVVEIIKLLRAALDKAGMPDVGVTPGECSNWDRFVFWGHATSIAGDPEAVKALGLITSHGFTGGRDYWYGTHNPKGVELLRLARPELHAWTTSMTWGKMDIAFLDDIRGQIYGVKVNSVIPWAAVQTSNWVGGDPNPGTALRVDPTRRSFEIMPGYWLYKQASRAGQPGMRVASASSSDTGVRVMAFAANGTRNPDAFVVVNLTTDEKPIRIAVSGTKAQRFAAWRTSQTEHYQSIGDQNLAGGTLSCTLPPRSATTFFARD
jgi:hypothetical protein